MNTILEWLKHDLKLWECAQICDCVNKKNDYYYNA